MTQDEFNNLKVNDTIFLLKDDVFHAFNVHDLFIIKTSPSYARAILTHEKTNKDLSYDGIHIMNKFAMCLGSNNWKPNGMGIPILPSHNNAFIPYPIHSFPNTIIKDRPTLEVKYEEKKIHSTCRTCNQAGSYNVVNHKEYYYCKQCKTEC